MINTIWSEVKDILFPVACAGCGEEGEWYCLKCLNTNSVQAFSIMAEDSGALNNAALSNLGPLQGVTALLSYNPQHPLGQLIRNFKYHGARESLGVWTRLWQREQAVFRGKLTARPTVMPVPLHPRRQRARGFNQAVLLAQAFASVFDLPLFTEGLIRARSTEQQAKLSRAARQANVAGAFSWSLPVSPPDQVVLVDDVYTTGATLRECAQALGAAGTKEVWGVVLARD